MPDWLLILIAVIIVVAVVAFIWWWMNRRSAPVAAAAPSAPGGEYSNDVQPYGPGSASPRPDGSGPAGFTVKGNADSMLFHTTDSPYYSRTKAEAWFRTEADAQKAGFTRWDAPKS
jgi:hypothetical protein